MASGQAADMPGTVADPVTRIWRLQYGPCWCHAIPSDNGSFDLMRLRTTVADLGGIRENLLIVSERVIDGSGQAFRQVHADVPDPKVVISTAPCPMAGKFWAELPVGWTPVRNVLPVDLEVEDCIGGNPEALMVAVLNHFFSKPIQGQSHDAVVTVGV